MRIYEERRQERVKVRVIWTTDAIHGGFELRVGCMQRVCTPQETKAASFEDTEKMTMELWRRYRSQGNAWGNPLAMHPLEIRAVSNHMLLGDESIDRLAIDFVGTPNVVEHE